MINSSGIGTCIKASLPFLLSQNPNWNFILLGDIATLRQFAWSNADNAEIRHFAAPIYSIQEQLAWRLLKMNEFDVIWAPNFNIPLLVGTKLLVTVHDVIFAAQPAFFSRTKALYARFFYAQIAKRASGISFASRFTMSEFIGLTGEPVGHSLVNHNGIDETWFEPAFSSELPSALASGPFIVFVGNLKPHKNLFRLVEAFGLLTNLLPHRLVIIGRQDGSRMSSGDNLLKAAARLGDRVHFTGYVDDDKLRAIVAKADLLVQPSLYEGFGLTPLEALAVGTPVAVSNIPAFQETSPDARAMFDPTSAADIAEKIYQAISVGQRPSQVTREALRACYSWAQYSRNIAALINRILIERQA